MIGTSLVISISSNECTVATPKSVDKTMHYCTRSLHPFVERVEHAQGRSVPDFELETMTEVQPDNEILNEDYSHSNINKDERMESLSDKLREYTKKSAELEECLSKYNAKYPFMTETETEEFSMQCYLLKKQTELFHENYNQVFNKSNNVSFVLTYRIS